MPVCNVAGPCAWCLGKYTASGLVILVQNGPTLLVENGPTLGFKNIHSNVHLLAPLVFFAFIDSRNR